DLWRFDITNKRWAWMKGTKVTNSTTPVGHATPGQFDPANTPACRQYVSGSWKDVDGNFWLFGASVASTGRLGDLWKYDANSGSPTYNQWAFMKGDVTTNFIGTYGSKGIPAPTNRPGARVPGTVWQDSAGNFWLFSGTPSSGHFNDVWRLAPVNTVPAQPGVYTAAPASVCQGASNIVYTVPAV